MFRMNKKLLIMILILIAVFIGVGVYFLFFNSDGGSIANLGSSIPSPPPLPN